MARSGDMREASSRADIGRIEMTNTKCCDKSGMRMFGMSYTISISLLGVRWMSRLARTTGHFSNTKG